MPEDLLFSVAPYPLRIIEPIASRWAIEASQYTWWGRTELHICDGRERRKHLEAMTTAIGCDHVKFKRLKSARRSWWQNGHR